MRTGSLVRDALLVAAPVAAVLAGVASVTHRQRLVEAGYRVGQLEQERETLDREVQALRVAVGRLTSPPRLLREVSRRDLPLDYPKGWNRVIGDGEAQTFLHPPVGGGGLAAARGGRR